MQNRPGRVPSSLTSQLTRRQLMRRGSALMALGAVPGLLAACGSSDDDGAATSTAGTSTGAAGAPAIAGRITMLNYEGWMGRGQLAAFTERYPEASVKEVYGLDVGSTATITGILQNPGEYDLSLAGSTTAGHLVRAKAVEEFDAARVPNLERIPQFIRDAYPMGIPTDYGRIGYGYRRDLIDERPTSWADLWRLAPKYSGKVTMLKYDTDVFGAALKYLGYNGNSTDPDELNEARDALIEIKPHLRAFLATDSAKPLLDGSGVLAMTYDYEIANAQRKNDEIVWVEAEEGTRAYLDGWTPLAGTELMDTIYAFMDFSLEPEVYANFINTIGAAYIMPDAEPYIDREITGNAALAFNLETIEKLDIEKFDDPEGAARRTKAWQEVLSA